MARTGTMSVTMPVPRRTVLSIDGADTVLVKRCAGSGPYTLTVRLVTRWDRAWWWLRARRRRAVKWLARPVTDWWWSRCEARWCWREEIDGYCLRHMVALGGRTDV